MNIDMMTPVQASHCSGEIRKRWKSFRALAIKNKLAGADIAKKDIPSHTSDDASTLVNQLQL